MTSLRGGVNLVLGAVAVWLVAGCSRPLQSGPPNPLEIDVREYDRVFRASMDVLHEQGFVLDRENYRFGTVSTRPLAAPTIFEVWKTSNTTSRQALAATMTDQRRIAIVHIEPVVVPVEAPAARPPGGITPGEAGPLTATTEPAAGPSSVTWPATRPATVPISSYRLSVEVDIERLSIPNRRLSGSTTGPEIINTLKEVPAELTARGILPARWQPIGRDPYLEQRLLADIIRRSVVIASEAPDTGPTDTP